MNGELIGYGVGICFAAIIVFFLILLTKDSEFFKSLFGRTKKKEEKAATKKEEQGKKKNVVTGAINKVVNQNNAPKIAKSAKIYYRYPGERQYTVADVEKEVFTIGGPGSKADLELKDASVAPRHAEIRVINEDGELYYCFTNLCKTLSNTEYLDQSGKKPEWMYMPAKDKVTLKQSREAFYVGEVKILIEAYLMNHQSTESDNDLLGVIHRKSSDQADDVKIDKASDQDAGAKVERTSSVRTFEKDVLNVDDVIC